MIIVALWRWWYRYGWYAVATNLIKSLGNVATNFSVAVLLRTLFSPWKQTVDIAGPNTPITVRFKWWIGNQVSRFIGFIVRTIVLATALLVLIFHITAGLILLLVWPLLPVVAVISLLLGLGRLIWV